MTTSCSEFFGFKRQEGITLKRFVQKIEEINSWHFLWIGVVFAEFFTFIMNTILSFLWWGRISIDLLLIGTIDAFIVAFLVGTIIIYFVNKIKETKIINSQLLQKLDTSRSIAASLAHEFGNPLCGIKGILTAAVRPDTLPADNAKMVGMALDECDRMSFLLQSLQDFNRPASGEKTPANLNRVIDDIVIFSRHKLERKAITIKKEYASNLSSIMVIIDQIKQVIMNLVNNSVYACAKGGAITISTSEKENNVIVRISDNGHGIEENDLSRIFDPFYTTKALAMGTGLGLSVSYGVIRRHGGTIKVASKVGEGTTFTISLPKEAGQAGVGPS